MNLPLKVKPSIISLDTENAFDKIQHFIMKKVLEIKAILEHNKGHSKPAVNINSNKEKFKEFSVKPGRR